MKSKKHVGKIILFVLCLWYLGKTAGCIFMLPGPWGPEIRGPLPGGGYAIFQSRGVGKESNDRLIWFDSKSYREYYANQTHAGPQYVILKLREDGKGLWVEWKGTVGASLDLTTGEFRAEQEPQFKWAQYGKGQIIAQGSTWSILQMLVPW